jgi:outer membrane protein assembly factor BamB
MSAARYPAMIRTAALIPLAACLLAGEAAGGERSKSALPVLWKASTEATIFQPYLAASGKSVYASNGERILILEAGSGRPNHEFKGPPGELLSGPTVVGEGIVVTAGTSFLHAVDRTGKEVWRYPFGASVLKGEFPVSNPPVVSGARTILVAGPDGNLHAVDSRTGSKVWQQPIATYAAGVPAFLLGVAPGLVLADARPSQNEPPQLLALTTDATSAKVRFTARLGIDISSLVAGRSFGVVAASYAETGSRRGSSIVAALDDKGGRRWTIDRGRHEKVLAITPGGELVSTSQDAAGADPGALVEFWAATGEQRGRIYVDGAVYAAAIGAEGSVYAVGCKAGRAVVYQVGSDRRLAATVDVGEGCPVTAAMDASGRLFVAHRTTLRGKQIAQIVAIRTPSKAAAAMGWAMPRADARGSAAFALSGR